MGLTPPFGLAENATVPLPLPLVPAVTCIHPTLLTAVQVQPAGAVTLTLPNPPPGPKEPDVAESEEVQASPASLAVKVWPAMVSVPLRPLLLTLAFTTYDTVPLALPDVPAEICTNPELLFALQPQPAGAVTFTLPVPPPPPKEALVADNEYVHCGGAVDGAVATAIGYTPTRWIVLSTVLLETDTWESVNANSFVTYAFNPSALTATEVGLLPVGTVAIKVFEAVSITATEEEFPFVTKTREPEGVAAAQFGNANPDMVVTRPPVESCTVTEFEYWLAT
jgi:hypothetical protein